MENFKPARLFDADGDLNERWFVFYSYRDPETGKFHRFKKYLTSRASSRADRYLQARTLIKQINLKLQQGFNPFSDEARSVTVIQAFKHILKIKSSYCRPRTISTYRYVENLFIDFLEKNKLADLPSEFFNVNHAQSFMDWVMKDGIRNPRTYNNILESMRILSNGLMARNNQMLQLNSFTGIKMLPEQEAALTAFGYNETKIVNENLPGYDFNLFIIAQLIYYCFLRPQEIVRMKVKNIFLDEQIILITGEISKNKKNQTIMIPDPFMKDLRNFDLGYPGEFYLFSKRLRRGSTPIAPTRIAEAWRKWANIFGIEKNIYSLVNTGAGRATRSGISSRDIQLHKRHHSLEMTQIYLDKFSRTVSDDLVKNFPPL
jgi:integrase